MFDLLFIFGIAWFSAAVGLRLLDALDARPGVGFDVLALSVPLGLGSLALAGLALGELGFLTVNGLAGAIGAGAVLAGFRAWKDVALLFRDALVSIRCRSALDFALMSTLLVAIVGTFLTALAPVTDGDALCYHLLVPKRFLQLGRLSFDPDLHETVYPLLTELLYGVSLAFRGPIACRLVQWLLGLVFAANVATLARPSLGARSWWAGAIAILVPAISNGMGAPLNDVALAAFGTASIVSFMRYHDQPRSNHLVLTAGFVGLTMGVKYPALVLGGLLGLAIAFVGLRPWLELRRTDPGRGRWSSVWSQTLSSLAIYAGVALLVGGAWYLRAWVYTGNPVYPFFRQFFGGAGLDEVLDPIKRPMAVNAWNLMTALIPLTLQPDRFDSFSHQLGPVFLLLLPALLVEKAPRRVLGIVAIGMSFLMICLTQRQSMRFVLIAVGPMSVGVAWLAATWTERRSYPCRLLLLLLVLIAGFEASLAAARARHGLRVVAGLESSEDYLMRREPTYRVGRWVADNLPASARIVGQDHRGYYIPCAYTMELAHRRRTGLGQRGETAAQVAAELRKRGFTHVMFCPPIPERAVEFDPTLGRLLAGWLDTTTPIYHEEIKDADNVVRSYAIYALDEERAVSPRLAERERR